MGKYRIHTAIPLSRVVATIILVGGALLVFILVAARRPGYQCPASTITYCCER